MLVETALAALAVSLSVGLGWWFASPTGVPNPNRVHRRFAQWGDRVTWENPDWTGYRLVFDRVEVVDADGQPVGSRAQCQYQRQVLTDLVNGAPSLTVMVGPDLFQWFDLAPNQTGLASSRQAENTGFADLSVCRQPIDPDLRLSLYCEWRILPHRKRC